MIESKPDWVLSRQRAWGVPITVFVRENGDGTVEILRDEQVNHRIVEAFEQEGADAWYADGARERFLGDRASRGLGEGRRHPRRLVRFRLDPRLRAGGRAAFPDLAGIRRKLDGGDDTVMYLEGSDQHRGWFHSSLLESCGTRGRAPYDVVLTHGFTLDEHGRKMSKSLGNVVAPQDVIKQSGADILRLWVCAADYCGRPAHRPGDPQDHGRDLSQAAQHAALDARHPRAFPARGPRRVRRDAGARAADAAPPRRARRAGAAGLRRLRLQAHLRGAQPVHDGRPLGLLFRHPQGRALLRADLVGDAARPASRCSTSCSARPSPGSRRCCRSPPRRPGCRAIGEPRARCISSSSPRCRPPGATTALAEKWRKVRQVRRVVTGALELERADKRIGSSLEAAPVDPRRRSGAARRARRRRHGRGGDHLGRRGQAGEGPADAFRLPDVAGVAVEFRPAQGRKCARSWKILPSVGSDPDYPDVSPRDAQALREWDALRRAAE